MTGAFAGASGVAVFDSDEGVSALAAGLSAGLAEAAASFLSDSVRAASAPESFPDWPDFA